MSSSTSADPAPTSDPGLIAGLYDAAAKPAGWNAACEAIRKAFDAETGVLYRQAEPDGPPLVLAAYPWAPGAPGKYRDHFARHDPVLAAQGSVAFLSHDALASAEALQPELYDDFALPQSGGAFHTLCAVIRLSGDDFARIGLHRPIERRPFNDADRRALEALTRHIAGALRLQDLLQAERQSSLLRGAALDQSRHGTVVVTAGGEVVFANEPARRLATEKWLNLSIDGLSCRDQTEAVRLAKLIRNAAQGGPGGCARISRGPKQPILAAMVSPLQASLAPEAVPLFANRGMALVTLRDLGATSDAGQAELIELFGLTAAEAAIVPQLLAGDSMSMIAQTRGVSAATVQAQSRRLLQKTGAPNLRALATMIAVLGSE